MLKVNLKIGIPVFFQDFWSFLIFLRRYFKLRFYSFFVKFELVKDLIVDLLYRKRGKYVRPFLHFGTIALIFMAISFGPLIFASSDDQNQATQSDILNSNNLASSFTTKQAEEVQLFRGGEIIEHPVAENETISSIAERYGLSVNTILWENNLPANAKIKTGDVLRILPVDGVRHKVQRGETIYSIGKKYGLDQSQVQVIVDYPFNFFLNDETFELAIGQDIIVPDGIKPTQTTAPVVRVAVQTKDAGAVSATGVFAWPASGTITQGYRFYHKAWDIANRGAGPILAADSGTVIFSGWDPSGYGNKVMVDHGNGYVTLYAHMSVLQVQSGQRVTRGSVLGQMGSTGRSTGIHLHFEIRNGGVLLDPGNFLK